MNGAELVPKNAIAIFTLRQHRSVAGKVAALIDKFFGIRLDITRNAFNIAVSQIGAAIAFTALTAFSTFKKRIGMEGIKWHDESPKLFSK